MYDSVNGRGCHQCRQKTVDFAVSKTVDFAVSCSNQVESKRCRSHFCHKCLLSRKKQGLQPTGILIHAAKANGYSSVLELLHVKGFGMSKTEGTSSKRPIASNEEHVVRSLRRGHLGGKVQSKEIVAKIPQPQGIESTKLGEMSMPAEDIGQALQSLKHSERQFSSSAFCCYKNIDHMIRVSKSDQ
ncbi:hypothetical protein RJ639_003420 [Escallonia herrerae]|uniref:Zinc-finger domain-containing protein n=1 Tax=Escallonia herrerae TaxID=1293975 RepID=A0AA89AWD5_9ASTE|nr:hypothetical protein RJ639_003420 [Escallonia herrerae]